MTFKITFLMNNFNKIVSLFCFRAIADRGNKKEDDTYSSMGAKV